jgi:AcrR family transcriptional regulator
MTKGEQTRQRIIEQSAQLFSKTGYFGTSIADIVDATALQKGGLYAHFSSKDDLALAAFDYAFEIQQSRFKVVLKGIRSPLERIRQYLIVFATIATDPPLVGGCPVLNTAIESDDAIPQLKARAQGAMNQWYEFLQISFQKAVDRGEVYANTSPTRMASFFIASLEGAIMLSKLYDDSTHMQRVLETLQDYLTTISLKPTASASEGKAP